jgi:hypothetical protein
MLGETKLAELFTTQDGSSFIHGRLTAFMELFDVHLPKASNIMTGTASLRDG